MGYNGDHPQSDSMKQDDVQQGSEIDTRKQDDVCNKLLLEPKLTRLQGHERIVWSSVRRSWLCLCDGRCHCSLLWFQHCHWVFCYSKPGRIANMMNYLAFFFLSCYKQTCRIFITEHVCSIHDLGSSFDFSYLRTVSSTKRTVMVCLFFPTDSCVPSNRAGDQCSGRSFHLG